ncbi:heparinase [Nocardioides sp. BGMRC 2183]|nr:heparinase [Nocardioides sp. BGMRC 2183]
MSPAEMAARGRDKARQWAWTPRQVAPGEPIATPPGLLGPSTFTSPLPDHVREEVPAAAAAAVVATADALMAGTGELLGTVRSDLVAPDWFHDPVTGRRAPASEFAFRIDHRDEDVTGNVKAVWELSRHHHLSLLATAYWLTHDERYAERVDQQLRSWWGANPFLSGIHWTSGIELGVRLISWAWIRRLLHDWPKVADLFETNQVALAQIAWHQQYLAAFRSNGSSANNHLILEAAGRVVGACAFPWFAESDRWRADAIAQFERAYRDNTFASGVNRELATDYHRFVVETAALVGAEAAAAGTRLSEQTWALVAASFDAAAALPDATLGPPRQGDGDEGRALLVDAPTLTPWAGMLDLGRHTVGPLAWWPPTSGSVLGPMVGALAGGARTASARPSTRPSCFPDAGIAILRSAPGDGPEIWCRCDGGPHGFLSIAAHGHADALSVEVRYDGVEILVDPGTYCYHGEPEWRSYFRSTRAHNTIEVDRLDQSVEGGPFLWSTQAVTVVDQVETDDAARQFWAAHHDGYARLQDPVGHRRSVSLDSRERRVSILDRLSSTGRHEVALSFHLGPLVEARLDDGVAQLSWPGRHGIERARLELPDELEWSTHRGEVDPPRGWYSPRFGERVPTTTILGRGVIGRTASLGSGLQFTPDHPGAGGHHG